MNDKQTLREVLWLAMLSGAFLAIVFAVVLLVYPHDQSPGNALETSTFG